MSCLAFCVDGVCKYTDDYQPLDLVEYYEVELKGINRIEEEKKTSTDFDIKDVFDD